MVTAVPGLPSLPEDARQPMSNEAGMDVDECLESEEAQSDRSISIQMVPTDSDQTDNSTSAKQEDQVKHEKEEKIPNATTTNLCCFNQWPIRPDEISYVGYGIYLGTQYAVCTDFLRANGITHVLSIGCEHKEPLDDITCKFLTLWEGQGARERLEEILDSAISFIDEGIMGQNKILVHCLTGVSRSPIVVMAYLHAKKGFIVMEAFAKVALKRPSILPRPGFRRFLEQKAKVDDGVVGDLDGCYILWPPEGLIARKDDLCKLGITFRNCHKDDWEIERVLFWTEVHKELPPLESPPILQSRLKEAVLRLTGFCRPHAIRKKIRESYFRR